ncbi:MAG: class II fructose-bisphosphate aldolase [Candidatus Marinimicrobia bacterium]|nr:class II fructose-bisphosphate aldolase [Candidatus Neomarinimicrobiota bacterium]
MIYKNVLELKDSIGEILDLADDLTPKVIDEAKLKSGVFENIIETALFHEESGVRDLCNALIRSISKDLGAFPASIQSIYEAMGRGEAKGFTVPAINVRGMTHIFAETVYKAAMKLNVGPFIFEIARSEIGYTNQRPSEFSAMICAGAVNAGYKGPIFIQGDHFQIKPAAYKSDPEAEIGELKKLIYEAVEAEFYNIDVDSSTLVDLDKDGLTEQQRENYENCAILTEFIRKVEPHNVTISVGGEIGEVGKKNSTPEELEAFMKGYNDSLTTGLKGISKISVQTGTSHGGVVLPDGSIADVTLDLDTLGVLSTTAREKYGLSGAVQHGASTLPNEIFNRFPEVGASEIHLATGFQNQIYDHPALPAELRDKIYAYLAETNGDERKEEWTDEQFYYKTRKKGFGPFKREFWELAPEIKEAIFNDLQETFEFLFRKLAVENTKEVTEKFITEV